MKKLFSGLLLTICCVLFWPFDRLVAQSSSGASMDQIKDVVPPSPDASSLGEYADWPVNLYTGLPTIEIPIYTLQGRTISVPITLSYHASGIKVGETSSWVGLGWALNAGGVITRSVVGLPDDWAYEGYLSMRQYYNNPGSLLSGTVPANQDSTFTVQAGEGQADGMPDDFMFNAQGRSYRLIFEGNGQIRTQPESNLKVTCNWNNETWQVILEDGTVLNFGGYSATENVTNLIAGGGENNGTAMMTAWFLTSIVSPAGETVSFTYSGMTLNQHFGISQTDYLVNSLNGNTPTPGYGTGFRTGLATCGCTAPNQLVNWGSNILNTNGLQTTGTFVLSSIQTDLGRVDFFQDATMRQDLNGGYALDSIKVYNKLAGQYIREFVLSHSYSTASQSTTIDQSAPDTHARYRLHLDSLTEWSTDKSLDQKWRFYYNSMTLPAQTSFAQDHLGYYNGQVNNQTLQPEILTTNALYCPGFTSPDYLIANRSFSGYYTGAESLQEIVYPTGGYTIFNMEPNSYPSTIDVQQGTNMPDLLALGMNTPTPWTNTKSDTFRITQSQTVYLDAKALFSTDIAQDYGQTTTIAEVVIKGIGSNNSSDGGTMAFNKTTGEQTAYYFLKDTGTYVMTMSCPPMVQADFTLSTSYADVEVISFTYRRSLGIQTVPVLVGGLRLHSQLEYDNLNNAQPAIRRFYQYASPLVINPLDTINGYMSNLQVEEGTSDGEECNYSLTRGGVNCWQYFLVRNSSTRSALGSVQGGPIGYGQVTELEDSMGVNGSTVYTYYNHDDDLGLGSNTYFPYPPLGTTDWRRGLLLTKTTYNAANQPLTKLANTYSFFSNQYLYIIGWKAATIYQYGEVPLQEADMTKAQVTDMTEQVQKLTTVETTYDPSTGDSLVKNLTYYYDDSLNTQPIRTLYFDSRQDSVLSYARTALEEPAINGSIPLSATAVLAIDSMVSKNMVGPTLETEQYRQSTLAKKTLVNYRLANNNMPFQDNVMIQNGGNPIETRLYFRKYDPSGNLAEQAKAADMRNDYIYDYKSTYPIAQCQGADSFDIAYTSFEADGTGNWIISQPTWDPSSSLTGSQSYNLSNGPATKGGLNSGSTYIVSYWSRTGSSYSVTGTTAVLQGKTINMNGASWTYFEHTVTGTGTVTVSGSGGIDELRLYPKGALMTTYTYSPLIGMTNACDMDNKVTYYFYDGLGRLRYIKDQDGNILKTIEYHYMMP
jgi:hypothetical protein